MCRKCWVSPHWHSQNYIRYIKKYTCKGRGKKEILLYYPLPHIGKLVPLLPHAYIVCAVCMCVFRRQTLASVSISLSLSLSLLDTICMYSAVIGQPLCAWCLQRALERADKVERDGVGEHNTSVLNKPSPLLPGRYPWQTGNYTVTHSPSNTLTHTHSDQRGLQCGIVVKAWLCMNRDICHSGSVGQVINDWCMCVYLLYNIPWSFGFTRVNDTHVPVIRLSVKVFVINKNTRLMNGVVTHWDEPRLFL